MLEKPIWLTWHHSSRSRNMASAVGAVLHEVFLTKSLFQRHFGSSFWTMKVLIKKKPKIIYIQYSFLLLLIVDIYKVVRFGKVKIIADCHTKALRRKLNGFLNLIFWQIKKASFKLVDISIVHNDGMIPDIKMLHDNFFVIPDKIPHNKLNRTKKLEETYCLNISSFAVDEPVEEVIDAARLLVPDKINIFWTGKTPESLKTRNDLPTNLRFTDYLSFDEFYSLLANADCSMGLTTEEDCLQSGAYESMDFEIPMVLSDTAALRDYFQDTAVYTKIKPQEIANAVREAIRKAESIRENIKKLKQKKEDEHREIISKLLKKVNDIPTSNYKARI